MADSSSNKPPEKQELSVEIRLLLAFVLMGVVLFTTPYLFNSLRPRPLLRRKPKPLRPVNPATRRQRHPLRLPPFVEAAVPPDTSRPKRGDRHRRHRRLPHRLSNRGAWFAVGS
jgi:hypothetical protein